MQYKARSFQDSSRNFPSLVHTRTWTYSNHKLRKILNSKCKWFKFLFRWWKTDRWRFTKRLYKGADVASLRSSIDLVTPSHYLSKKLYWTLRNNFEASTCSKTYGALDVIQLINMCKYLTSIYVSGWQCSSTHVPNAHEPGPDFADYPMNTVPDKVKQLVSA